MSQATKVMNGPKIVTNASGGIWLKSTNMVATSFLVVR